MVFNARRPPEFPGPAGALTAATVPARPVAGR
ncbi:hypothetical protein SAMN05216489_01399 [Streptomyces sp. 3213]|nr:hypothetical protein SAMN05216489_01399 [Streptomyces sp. 3213] [Streptomyces sp. 3213.3]